MRSFLICAFFAVLAHAQQGQSGLAPTDADKKKIRVEGRVVALNGEAVRKATVRLQVRSIRCLAVQDPPSLLRITRKPPTTTASSRLRM